MPLDMPSQIVLTFYLSLVRNTIVWPAFLWIVALQRLFLLGIGLLHAIHCVDLIVGDATFTHFLDMTAQTIAIHA